MIVLQKGFAWHRRVSVSTAKTSGMPAVSAGRILPHQIHPMSDLGFRMRGSSNGQGFRRPRYDHGIVLAPRHTLRILRENAPKVILPDVNLVGISSKSKDDIMTAGNGGKSTYGRSNASVSSSSQPPAVSPPMSRDMRVKVMAEGEDAAEPVSQESGQESSQEDREPAEMTSREQSFRLTVKNLPLLLG